MSEKLREAIDQIDRMIEDAEAVEIADSSVYSIARIETLRQVRNILVRQYLSS